MPNFSGIWNATEQFQARAQNIWPATPGAPTIGTATAGNNLCASVAFTAPACTGRFPSGISSYTAISTPGCITVSGASSPLTVSGLTDATSYTFRVRATGANGTSPLSAASNSITATNASSQSYTTAGTYTWVAPSGVTAVSVVTVGGGGSGSPNGIGGGGGGLRYRNNYSVTPGSSYTVVVGAGPTGCSSVGGVSSFNGTGVLWAGGGGAGTSGNGVGGAGSTIDGSIGGGNGGTGRGAFNCSGGGPGGAGGYSGNGGCGAQNQSQPGLNGSGGGGGGGGGGYSSAGGVGIFGQGANGVGGSGGGVNGTAGSGGSGVAYGGGVYSGASTNSRGAVRIVWPGNTRTFPSTNVGAP